MTAKLGSDYKKPDAITRIERDNYAEIVYPLPVEDLLYVGPATSKKLRSVGINTIGRLAETSDDFLQRRLGKMGLILSTFAKGMDVSPVLKTDHISTIKSVGNSATTPRDLVNEDDVYLMLILLSESVCARMRELASKCTVVEVSVRNTELHSFNRQRKLQTPTCSSLEMAQVALELFRENYRWELPIRSIGVRGSGLVAASECDQLSLFLDDMQRQKRERIEGAVDAIRSRFGYMSIQRAAIFADPQLAGIRPKEHVVHPVGYFGR